MDYIKQLPIETLVGIIVSLLGVYISLSTRRKNNSDATVTITEAAKNIVEINQKEMDRLRVEDVAHESYINYLLGGILKLQSQLRRHGIKPAFHPMPILIFIEKEKAPE